MNSNRRAVVARSRLRTGGRRVALIAERLALVGTDLDEARAVMHLREREAVE